MNDILHRAMQTDSDEPLWGCYNKVEQHCDFYTQKPERNVENMLDYVVVYNQSTTLSESLEELHAKIADQQALIEIFEDTKGVLGLRAYQKQGKMLQPLDLELE